MSDNKKKTYTLQELATITSSEIIGNPEQIISGVADVDIATPTDVCFVILRKYEKKLPDSKAGAVIVSSSFKITTNHNFLISEDPETAFEKIASIIYKEHSKTTAFTGIHSTAVIHPSAKIGNDITIGPHAVIDENATIGDRTEILAGAFIGAGVFIGEDCKIYQNVVIRERCSIGKRVILHPGVVIGLCGFGYKQDRQGHHHKLTHYGTVVLEDDVELGSNTVIARARFNTTIVGEGTKIDCLCEIGHNVRIGKHVIIVGQSAISGSSRIGNHVMMGGKVGTDAHMEIGDFVMIRAFSGISKSLPGPGAYGGLPAIPLAEENRNAVHVRQLGKTMKKLKELEQKIEELSKT